VSTVVQRWQAWLVENRNGAQGSGCPRRTPDKQDRHLRFLAFRDHHMSSSSVAPAWYNVMGGLISMPTIYHRIRSWGLHSYRPHLVLPLTCERRRQRLDCCRERINWDAEWNVVVFSDEFRFCTMQLILLNGMWGAICYGSRPPLIFIQSSRTARRGDMFKRCYNLFLFHMFKKS
jgi:hypothetical protein